MAAVISFCGPWALGAGTKGPGNRGAKRGHKEAQGKPRTGSQGGRAQEGPGERAREGWPRRGLGGLGPGPSGPYVTSVCLIIAAVICFFSCCLVFFGCCHCFFCLLSLVFAANGPRAQEPGDQGPWGPGKSPGIDEGEPRGTGRPPSNKKQNLQEPPSK